MALAASLGVITRRGEGMGGRGGFVPLPPPSPPPHPTPLPPCPQSPGAEAKDSRAQMDQVKLSQTGIQSKLPERWSCKGFTVGQLSQAFVSCVERKKKARHKACGGGGTEESHLFLAG